MKKAITWNKTDIKICIYLFSDTSLDIIFLIDTSSVMLERLSSGQLYWEFLQDQLYSFISRISSARFDVRIAVLSYGEYVETIVQWSDGLRGAQDLIRNYRISQSVSSRSYTSVGLEEAISLFRNKPSDRSNNRNVLITLQAESITDDISRVIDSAGRYDISIYSIGLTDRVRTSSLEELGYRGGYWTLSYIDQFSEITENIYQVLFFGESIRQYVVVPGPDTLPGPEYHELVGKFHV